MYKWAKVRYKGRWWVLVKALVLKDGRFSVKKCELFPRGGYWHPWEAYFI